MTDTNQASEDVLKDQIDDVFARACNNNEYFGYDGWYELHTPTMRVEIKELIRTEKLKLLAEVRERVVGEDERHDNGQAMVTDPSLCMDCTNPDERFGRNTFRADQRILLDKLEAEL